MSRRPSGEENRQVLLDFTPRKKPEPEKPKEVAWKGGFDSLVAGFDEALEKALDRGFRVKETVEQHGKKLTDALERALGNGHELVEGMRAATASKDQGKVFEAIAKVREHLEGKHAA
jgi:hypothetical protein